MQLCTSGIPLADGPRTLIGAALGRRGVGPLDVAVAEVKRFDLTADDTFLVIGCDGIWDVLSDQQVRSLTPCGYSGVLSDQPVRSFTPCGYSRGVWALFRLSRLRGCCGDALGTEGDYSGCCIPRASSAACRRPSTLG